MLVLIVTSRCPFVVPCCTTYAFTPSLFWGIGRVADHSYLGSREDFEAYADRYKTHLTTSNPTQENGVTDSSSTGNGAIDCTSNSNKGAKSEAHDHLLIYQRMLQLRDEHALCNWTAHNEVGLTSNRRRLTEVFIMDCYVVGLLIFLMEFI